MAILKITSDGDPFPAKAGAAQVDDARFGVVAGQPINTGGTRIFADARTGFNAIVDQQPNKVYNITYRAGDRDTYSQSSQVVAENTPIGVAVNGAVIYTAGSKTHQTDGTNSGASLTYNLGNSTYNTTLDQCGGRPEINGEYRYRNGSFIYKGFSNPTNPNMLFVNSSTYYSGTKVGSDYLKHESITHDAVVFGEGHSKIVGWALDGFPIYGPFGYQNPLDPTSNVVQMLSTWGLKGPSDPIFSNPARISNTPGIYIEDYEIKPQTGTLDAFNGRYCVTPDFKNGTYAYFLTFEEAGEGDAVPTVPAYPYVIGTNSKQPRSYE